MTNTKSTKRALLASVMALFLCFTMLLGTTFAWFTDSVSNGVNKIQSGNLDIELYHMNYAEAVAAGSANGMAIPKDEDGFKVVGDTKLFLNEDGKEMLWEPGATSVENFRIVNEGTLALKYQFKITFSNATATPDGKTLADIINISASETKYDETTGHAVGVDGNATLNDRKLGEGHVFEGTLLPGEAYNFWVGLQWLSSDVDDDFNVEGGLSIDLGVTLLATQLSYEKDNYAGDQYDAGAQYPEFSVANDIAQLAEALEAGEDVVLLKNIAVQKTEAVSNGYGVAGVHIGKGQTLDGNGMSVGVNAWSTWDTAINTTGGVIKNVTVNEGMRGIFISHNSNYSDKVILENVVIDGTIYTISCDQGTGKGLDAIGCTFNGWTSYAATIGEVKFVDCSFGEGQGYAFCRPYAVTVFEGCNFEAGYELDARAAVTFKNCTIDGVALTADNLSTLVVGGIDNVTVQ